MAEILDDVSPTAEILDDEDEFKAGERERTRFSPTAEILDG